MKKLLCGLSILFIVAYCAGYNHPEIKWRTVTTEHFAINYYDKTEPALYAAWKIAEETYAAIAPLFDYKLRNRIELSIADYDDYSNGWADYTSGSIMIWVPDNRFEYRGNNTWLRNVISHEITHILSLESKRRSQMLDIGFDFKLSSKYEDLTIQDAVVRITPWPNWFAEGIAQLGAEKLGHDCWDSQREMLLRTAVMSNTVLNIDEMGNFSHDSHGNEMVYNQGYSFIKFLVNHLGLDTVTSIARAGTENRIDFRYEFSNRTGRQIEAFYGEWLDSLKNHYSIRSTSDLTSEKIISHGGLINALPMVSPDGKLMGYLSSGTDDGGQTDLLIIDNSSGRVIHKIRYAHTSWAFSADSKKVYYIKSRDPDSKGSYLNDLFEYDLESKKVSRLTKGLRVYNVAVSPVNGLVGVIEFSKGMFTPGILNMKTGDVKQIAKTVIGNPFIKMSWSPADSARIALEQIVDGRSQISIYSLNDTAVVHLTKGPAREESPYWAADGRIYFSADYDGVNNIYSVRDDGSDLNRYSNVMGGCFSPFVGSDKKIVYSGYGSSGFTIAQIDCNGQPYEVPQGDHCVFKALPTPKGKLTINANGYKPHYGRALSELAIFGGIWRNNGFVLKDEKVVYDTTVYNAGVSVSRFKQDPLQKKNRSLGLVIGIEGEYDSKTNGKKKSFAPAMLSSENNFLYKKALMKMPEVKGEILSSKILKNNDFDTKLHQTFESQAANADSSDTNAPNVNIFFQPMISLVNNESDVSLQLQVAAITPIIPIPVVIQASLLGEYQLSKNATIGFGIVPIVTIYPWVYGQIPLVFNWSTLGTYNEDFNYNFNNASQVTISAGADFIPFQKIEYVGLDSADTSLYNVNSFYASAGFFHAFSFGKYSALQLELQGNYSLYDRDVWFTDFDDGSNMLLQSLAGARMVFPIVRNINTGNTYYFDNFYGSVGYTLLLEMNGVFLENPSRDILKDNKYSRNASAGHLISATLELGHYKSNMFFKKFIVGVDYELLREKVYLKVASEF
jgi:Tol biopolymer transport system component